ncbi:TIGR00159 family protein [Phototrophicus methaneseepsis]|uniref:Diadenylate cyclase n=1 Tax=Phototrophicus methaneseepsis TaxID=2710758 RepID=A0A7S8E7H4_9CHLR|nr:diadenylate cyclase CdaA [Phototrophicus methaneseepsis]QPC81752.1 TIGR00159 family protein [Phototrophicus methaneseepsis]
MDQLIAIINTLTPTDLLDIFFVTLLFYGASFLFRGTQAVVLLRGVMTVVIVLILVAGIFQLQALTWLLTNGLAVFAVAIPVIFQPELRRGLEQLGRGSRLLRRSSPVSGRDEIIAEIVRASEKLSERRHGALIVLQKNTQLDDYIRTGTQIDSKVKADLLLTIFWPKTELHDGAVIVGYDGRIASAAAVLPLTASRNLPHPKMGMRHRAALGMSESSDAVCVVVSEETGRIAIMNNGRMIPRLDPERLRTVLGALYGSNEPQRTTLRGWLAERWASLSQQLQESRT